DVASCVQLRKIFAIDVDILISAAGKIHNKYFTLRARRLPDRFGHGVRGFKRRNQPLIAGKPAGRFKRLPVASRYVLGAAQLPQPTQASTRSGSRPSASRIWRMASSPMILWKSRTITGYGCDPSAEPSR